MIADAAPLVVVVALVAGVTWWLRRRTGVAHHTHVAFDEREASAIGLAAGSPALVLFTAPSCPPCVTAKRVLDDVAVRHALDVLTVDVTEHHDVASAKRIFRAPTTFVIDERGRAVARIAGVPRDGELDHVLAREPAAA